MGEPDAVTAHADVLYAKSAGQLVKMDSRGDITVLASISRDIVPFGMAANDDAVFLRLDASGGHAIVAYPPNGGPKRTIATGLSRDEATWGLLADASYVYFRHSSREVYRVPAQGGTPEVALRASADLRSLTIDEANFYWLQDDGQVMAQPRDADEPIVVASGQSGAHDLAVGGGRVLWTIGGTEQAEGNGRILSTATP
jgi:hypothetical protein